MGEEEAGYPIKEITRYAQVRKILITLIEFDSVLKELSDANAIDFNCLD
jgi:hypothetical protein